MRSRSSLLALFLSLVIPLLLLGCGQSSQPTDHRRTLVIWGVQTGADSKDFEGLKNAFEVRHPEIKLRVLSMGAGGMNNQKLMTSIVGNVAPDVINQDRFEISDWASRGAFRPLDDLIARDKKDKYDPKESDFYPAPWAEASYDGHVFGIPTGADNRILYYNKALFREKASQLRAAGLDPDRPPRTWSEILAYSKVLTEFNPDGTLKVAGFIPNAGNSWLYMYAFQNNAPFMSADGRTCTLDTKYSEEALKFMEQGYEILGGYNNDKIFETGFQTNENDPFIVGKIAMKIDGDWILDGISRYGPNLDFGTAPAPVPDDRYNHTGRFANEKDTFITWVGGFAYAIPRGAKNVQDAWTFIKFATSTEGQMIEDAAQQHWDQSKGRIYVPRQVADRVSNELQLVRFKPADPRFAQALQTHVDMGKFGRVRPPSVVSNQLWQEHVKAIDNALYGKMSIHQALAQGQANVQRELNAFYDTDKHPILDLNYAAYASVVLVVLGLGAFVFFFKRARIGKVARREAKWAYFFISPWVIGFFVFTLGPMVASLLFSFTQWNVLTPARYVGLRNYAEMFGSDWPEISKSFYNVAYIGLFNVPAGLCLGLMVALLLNAAVRGMRFYRTFFYMPSIVPVIATIVLWIWIMTPDPSKGLLNAYWARTLHVWLGLPNPGWLTTESWSKTAVIIYFLWGVGGGMVLWLAGLKGVPTTLYEAAAIDGATPKQQFWSITIPQLSPIIFFNMVMGIIGAVQLFDVVFILKTPDGPVGPADSLITPVYHLFDSGFAYFKMGYASAIAWLIFAVIFVLTAIQLKFSKRWVHSEVDN